MADEHQILQECEENSDQKRCLYLLSYSSTTELNIILRKLKSELPYIRSKSQEFALHTIIYLALAMGLNII